MRRQRKRLIKSGAFSLQRRLKFEELLVTSLQVSQFRATSPDEPAPNRLIPTCNQPATKPTNYPSNSLRDVAFIMPATCTKFTTQTLQSSTSNNQHKMHSFLALEEFRKNPNETNGGVARNSSTD